MVSNRPPLRAPGATVGGHGRPGGGEMKLAPSDSWVYTPAPPPASRLTCTVVAGEAEAGRLRPAWGELLARSAARANGLALTPAWLLAWWREFGGLGGRRLRLLLFRRGGR